LGKLNRRPPADLQRSLETIPEQPGRLSRTSATMTEKNDLRRPGIREVAEHAGVAISSVSRVLSGHRDVSEAMREKVMGSVDALGYQPDMLAQSLRRRTTLSVGFAASDISNPVLAETVTGAERVLRGAGYSMLLTDAEGDPALDMAQIKLLSQRRVDGLLLSLTDEADPGTIAALRAAEVPFVLVDRDVPEGLAAAQVRFDHRAGMRDAAAHLWELGHRDIALISGGPKRPARERLAGIEEVFGSGGAELRILSGPFTIAHGFEATRQVLGSSPRPTAIIAAGNLYMRGALRAFRELELVLGRDISFIGCDDVAVAEFHDPPIALVRRDPRRIGEVAARLLLARLGIGEEPAAGELELPTEFAPGPSVTTP
jgi:LacI family transcriptional regulator